MQIRRWIGVTVHVVVLLAAMGRPLGAQPADHHLGVDVHIGGIPTQDFPEEEPDMPAMSGWQTGATVRFVPAARWFGVTGNYASHANDIVQVRDLLAGVRAASPWLVGTEVPVRGFAHALVGGADVFFMFRLQMDYVRTDLAHVPRNDVRGFLGAVVPLCFAGGRADGIDGFNLSGGGEVTGRPRHGSEAVTAAGARRGAELGAGAYTMVVRGAWVATRVRDLKRAVHAHTVS